MSDERQSMIILIDEARAAGARQSKACNLLGISAKTYKRWITNESGRDGRLDAHHEPLNKLSEFERQRLIQMVNTPEFAHLPPSQIVPRLADLGSYLASESTIYRVLKDHKQSTHRQAAHPKNPSKKPLPLIATEPNQIYSWDITYLPTSVKGMFFYLYLVMDIYSRKIVGWQVYEEETSALAADLMTDICRREHIQRHQVTLHSDNGSPMKGATMLSTLQVLGVMPSYSRPSVSNDNPYSESMFRTLKYRPEYPDNGFENLSSARQWMGEFDRWYNHEHRHSAIRFVTPHERHIGDDDRILALRSKVYEEAKQQHPERWSGNVRNWEPVQAVLLNPLKGKTEKEMHIAA